jgi:hypothetical protein
MKKTIKSLMFALIVGGLTSCGTLVEPNYGGVLMENYGKNGKSDFKEVTGRVSTMGMGTELYQVPMWEQRGVVDDTLHLVSADNNEIEAYPKYSYQINKGRLVDVIFDNRQLGKSGDDFLRGIESNMLEARIYDIIKEESRKHVTDTLMSIGGSLKFERDCERLIRKAFEEKGFNLITFVAQLKYSDKVREKIDQRLEVNTNISVIDQQIAEQKKKNELERLRTDFILIQNQALTQAYLQNKWLDKWDGKLSVYNGNDNIPVPMININKNK